MPNPTNIPSPTLTELLRQAGKILADLPPENTTAPSTVQTITESRIPKLSAVAVDNTAAIRKMMADKRGAEIPPGQWPISNDIRMSERCELLGLGNSKPTLFLDPASPQIQKRKDGKCWFSLIQSNAAPGDQTPLVGDVYGLPYGTASESKVRNLRLIGSFDQIKDPCTIAGIALEGTAIQIQGVDVGGVAKGLAGGECFPIRIYAQRSSSQDLGPSVIRRCRLESVGNAKTMHRGLAGEEITVFSVVGSPECQIQSPRIEDCEAINIRRNASQPSPIQVFHLANCKDAILRDCVVADSDATGFYVDSGTLIGTRIIGNTFRNVHRGIFVNGATTSDMIITGNMIATYYNSGITWNPDNPPACIILRAPGGTKPIFSGVYIYANALLGGAPVGTQAFYPRGVYVEAQDAIHVSDVDVCNNIIDIPRFGSDPRYYKAGQLDQLAIYFAFSYAWHPRAIKAWNNRSRTGGTPQITIVDSTYKPTQFVNAI